MKGFYSTKEEAEKSVNDALLDLDSGFIGYEENEHEEMDLSLLNEKESTKVLARMNKKVYRATLKKQKEEAKEKKKNRKVAKKVKKPHDKSIQKVARKSLNILEVIIDASPSCNYPSMMQFLLDCHFLHSKMALHHLLKGLQVLPLLEMSSSYRGPYLP